jgi:membrane-associated protein
MSHMLDYVLHLDKHLVDLVRLYGVWAYGILFLIVFAETGFVVTPFLPGDTLLFAVGMICNARHFEGGAFSVFGASAVLCAGAILGDQVNYRVGKHLGRRLFRHEHARILKPSHLKKTESFYARYGAKTVTIARFVAIVRTFAPFVAGMGNMPYLRFTGYSVLGALLWVISCVGAGYALNGIPFIRDHFEIGLLALLIVSLLPVFIEFMKHRRELAAEKKAATTPSTA